MDIAQFKNGLVKATDLTSTGFVAKFKNPCILTGLELFYERKCSEHYSLGLQIHLKKTEAVFTEKASSHIKFSD